MCVTDGGVTDGGVTDGGVTDGGVTDGGVTDGGVTDGGVTDGGVTDGGLMDGGAGPIVEGEAPTEASCGQSYRFQPVVRGESPFRYTLVEGPEGMTVNAETGLLEWLPLRKQVGQHAVVLRVEDARGATTDWRGTIDVTCEPKHYRVGCACGTGLPSTDVVWTGLLLSLGLRRRRR
jgi:hypothetical protein